MNKDLLDIKKDWVFKRVFGKEGNEDILADLLSAILKIGIKKVELKNTELNKDSEKQKLSILDIKAILNDNSIVDIEMQMKDKKNITDRDIQYLTKLYSEQLKKKEEYTSTKKVIVINILNFNYYNINTYHSVAHLKFEPYGEETYIKLYDKEERTLTDKLEIHIIELPKFLEFKNVKDSKLVNWLRLLSGEMEMMKMALSKKAEKIKKAFEEIEYLSQDEKARAEYDAYIEAEIDYQMKIDYATEKGVKKEKIEMVRELLKLNVPIDVIIKSSKLSEKEIEEIKKSL